MNKVTAIIAVPIILMRFATICFAASITVDPSEIPRVPATYPVTGTLANAASQFHCEQTNFAGETKLTYNYSLHVKVNPKCCSVDTYAQGPQENQDRKLVATTDDVTIAITYAKNTITEPTWTERQTCAAADNEWTRFISKLDVHENGHADINDGWATPDCINSYFDDFSYESECQSSWSQQDKDDAVSAAFEKAKSTLLNQWQHDADAAGDQYDANTSHGATQGATLNTGIGC